MLLASYSAQARPCGKNRLIQPKPQQGHEPLSSRKLVKRKASKRSGEKGFCVVGGAMKKRFQETGHGLSLLLRPRRVIGTGRGAPEAGPGHCTVMVGRARRKPGPGEGCLLHQY